MKLKENFNKEDISRTFQILKAKCVARTQKLFGHLIDIMDIQEKCRKALNRERAIWKELHYDETLAKAVDVWDRLNTKKIFAIGGGVLTVAFAAFFVTMALQPNAYSLEIDGRAVGYVESQAIVEEVITSFREELKETMGLSEVMVGEDAIACLPTREKKLELLNATEIKDLIFQSDVCKANVQEILVNGERVVAVISEEEANQILNDVKESYKTEGAQIIDCSYKEEVTIKECVASIDEIMGMDQAVNYILTGSQEPKTYTVKEGDTLWDIAYANNMKPAELIAANQDFNPDKLKIGQQLNLIAIEPYLTVTITEKLVAEEAIPFSVTYENSSSLMRGQTKVKSTGKKGVKEVVSQIVKENGRVIATTVLSETVLSEPIAQVAYKGTKPITLTAGSGVLSNPLSSMVVSDRFGASRGSRRHLGIDLRAPRGTAIYASDGGTVTQVSSNGSYGKLIVINHGGGLVTKYAHCDSISVSVGQKVGKGEKIGTVGKTGNATGYILHFEVLINGKAMNPLNYL